MELDKALDQAFAAEPVTEPVPEPAPQEGPQEPAPEPEAPVEPQPEPEPAPQPEEPKQQEHVVPLPKYLDTRDELKETKRRLQELENQLQQRTQPQDVPDPFDDPQGFAAHQQQVVSQQVAAIRFELGDQMARQIHGNDAVEQAIAWAGDRAKADPVFAASYMREANPVDWIVRQHKRDAVVSQIGDKPLDDFVKEYIAKNPALLTGVASAVAPVIPNAAIPQQAPAPAAPPRSLVNEPSSGGIDHTPVGLKAGVEAVFPR